MVKLAYFLLLNSEVALALFLIKVFIRVYLFLVLCLFFIGGEFGDLLVAVDGGGGLH